MDADAAKEVGPATRIPVGVERFLILARLDEVQDAQWAQDFTLFSCAYRVQYSISVPCIVCCIAPLLLHTALQHITVQHQWKSRFTRLPIATQYCSRLQYSTMVYVMRVLYSIALFGGAVRSARRLQENNVKLIVTADSYSHPDAQYPQGPSRPSSCPSVYSTKQCFARLLAQLGDVQCGTVKYLSAVECRRVGLHTVQSHARCPHTTSASPHSG